MPKASWVTRTAEEMGGGGPLRHCWWGGGQTAFWRTCVAPDRELARGQEGGGLYSRPWAPLKPQHTDKRGRFLRRVADGRK